MNENEVKKCPKCSGEMEIGFLSNAPRWTRGTSIWQIGGPRVFAFKCRNCGYVELYAEKKEGGPRLSKV
jgi:predicted nucleic-acid-binding Zn-ribbon protein